MKTRTTLGLAAVALAVWVLPAAASAAQPVGYYQNVQCADGSIDPFEIYVGWPPPQAILWGSVFPVCEGSSTTDKFLGITPFFELP